MQKTFNTPEDYLAQVHDDRLPALRQLRDAIRAKLPSGFEEVISYGMLGYVVPHTLYPKGYHCNPELPLPFMNLALQKNFVAVYHMGLYADPKLLEWFTSEYPKRTPAKLDMGKSCIRFKKPEHIPVDLIAELAGKMTPADWISRYEQNLQKK